MTKKEFGKYIIYVDESGVPSFDADKDYPVFVLAFCIFDKEKYSKNSAPRLKELKFKYFGHDMVIFHENEIRRDRGYFTKFKNPDLKNEFISDLTKIIEEEDFILIATVIKKDNLFSKNSSPYHIALKYCMERTLKFLQSKKEDVKITHIIIEQRGKKEDAELELEFRRICDGQNYEKIKMNFEIIMSSKLSNSAGLQIADLVARPIGIKTIKPNQENRAFDVIKTKLHRNKKGEVDGFGIKIFPKKSIEEEVEEMFNIL
jgi:hypothetical protein